MQPKRKHRVTKSRYLYSWKKNPPPTIFQFSFFSEQPSNRHLKTENYFSFTGQCREYAWVLCFTLVNGARRPDDVIAEIQIERAIFDHQTEKRDDISRI